MGQERPEASSSVPPGYDAEQQAVSADPTDPVGGATGAVRSGPLAGCRVVELAGLGPAPFCGMVLSDMGADVVRIDRVAPARSEASEPGSPGRRALWDRGRRSVGLDLKDPVGRETALALVARADALVEGYRPGVAERLGIGPDACLARNPRLVYGRVTGWGQDGPLSGAAGHDLNFIALSGALSAIGRAGEAPVPPLNLVGDFGGGGMLLVAGVCAALVHAARTGRGQVVDASMVDGSALLMTSIFGERQLGRWRDERGTNLLDSGAPFYDVYETKDGRYLAVAALERQFFAELVRRLGLADDPAMEDRMNRAQWPAMRRRFRQVFRSRTRAQWCAELEGTDACVTPVLDLGEVAAHPHNAQRRTFRVAEAGPFPAPAPRFSATPSRSQGPAPLPGEHTEEILADWGVRAGGSPPPDH